jgi:hypothetical protein
VRLVLCLLGAALLFGPGAAPWNGYRRKAAVREASGLHALLGQNAAQAGRNGMAVGFLLLLLPLCPLRRPGSRGSDWASHPALSLAVLLAVAGLVGTLIDRPPLDLTSKGGKTLALGVLGLALLVVGAHLWLLRQGWPRLFQWGCLSATVIFLLASGVPFLPQRARIPAEIITPGTGHEWIANLTNLGIQGPSDVGGERSQLIVRAGGRELQSHQLHDTIRQQGEGKFSHWGENVHFATFDNSDPRKSADISLSYPQSLESWLVRFFGPLLPEGSAVPGVLALACLLLALSPFLAGPGTAALPVGATSPAQPRRAA